MVETPQVPKGMDLQAEPREELCWDIHHLFESVLQSTVKSNCEACRRNPQEDDVEEVKREDVLRCFVEDESCYNRGVSRLQKEFTRKCFTSTSDITMS